MKFADIMNSAVQWTSDHIKDLENDLNKKLGQKFKIVSNNWGASYTIYFDGYDIDVAQISDTGEVYHPKFQRADPIIFDWVHKRNDFINDLAHDYTKSISFKATRKPVDVQVEKFDEDRYINTMDGRNLPVSKNEYVIHSNDGNIYLMSEKEFNKKYDIAED